MTLSIQDKSHLRVGEEYALFCETLPLTMEARYVGLSCDGREHLFIGPTLGNNGYVINKISDDDLVSVSDSGVIEVEESSRRHPIVNFNSRDTSELKSLLARLGEILQ